jgi:hypothetical protein
MKGNIRKSAVVLMAACLICLFSVAVWSEPQSKPPASKASAAAIPAPGSRTSLPSENKAITEADCTAAKLGATIPTSAIGEPVSGVTLSAPVWTGVTNSATAYCSVKGAMAPVDANAKPINFQVVLPASWSRRAVQMGGAGINGTIPNLLGGVDMGPGPSLVQNGFATYGSDSGHQMGFGFGFGGGMFGGAGGAASTGSGDDWALNDEAMKNLGYMQLKKTHDAAIVLMERIYGEKPRFNYFFGSSQGGREAITVAQRYSADYDGISANVPIVSFSSLMLAPELIRIQEKPLANWVPPAKVNAIRGEFIRQCDKLDGLADGIINNYVACRAIFDRTQAPRNSVPWSAKRCPNNVDPNPGDTSANACLTDGQISTLNLVYSRYAFATPLANDAKTFGMWTPNTDPSGSGLIESARFRGQEGAGDNARMHSHLGVLGVTGFLMKDLKSNPLDYIEGGALDARRREISLSLDSTNPNLEAFYKRGGKLIVVIGTNDTLASPGAQLDFYESVVKKMGREKVNAFARFFVLPQASHSLSGTNYTVDGDGKSIPAKPIPNTFNRLGVLQDWVEKNSPPAMSITVTGGNRSLPMCSYPAYPKYVNGPADAADSYQCAAR